MGHYQYKVIKGLFGFFFGSSLITHYSIFITHHLKYPNSLHPTCLATVFTTHHSNISTFLWVPYLSWVSNPSVISNRVPLPPFSSSLISSKKIKAQKIKAESKARKASFGKQAPVSVMCKVDAATLCVMCESDIHLANPLAHRHECVPVEPFFASPSQSSNRLDGKLGYGEERKWVLVGFWRSSGGKRKGGSHRGWGFVAVWMNMFVGMKPIFVAV